MPQRNDLSRSDTPLEQESTLIAVIEMSQSSWLVAGIVPGLERHPLKKLAPDEEARLEVLERQPATGRDAMLRLLARVVGVGVETADMLVHEILARGLRPRRAARKPVAVIFASLHPSPHLSSRPHPC